MLFNKIWTEGEFILKSELILFSLNLEEIFKEFKRNGVKIVINIGEFREFVVLDLMNFGLINYIDMLVCGDDFIF